MDLKGSLAPLPYPVTWYSRKTAAGPLMLLGEPRLLGSGDSSDTQVFSYVLCFGFDSHPVLVNPSQASKLQEHSGDVYLVYNSVSSG